MATTAEPSSDQLFAAIQHSTAVEVNQHQQRLEQVRTALATPRIHAWWEQLSPSLEKIQDESLKEWVRLGFLGACVGFMERELLPFLPEHQYIYERIIQDLTETFQRIQEEHLAYDPEALKYQIYDYGIQCIYYLDWQLYISQECY